MNNNNNTQETFQMWDLMQIYRHIESLTMNIHVMIYFSQFRSISDDWVWGEAIFWHSSYSSRSFFSLYIYFRKHQRPSANESRRTSVFFLFLSLEQRIIVIVRKSMLLLIYSLSLSLYIYIYIYICS